MHVASAPVSRIICVRAGPVTITLALLTLAHTVHAQDVYHVDGVNGHDTNNDGESWAAPFTTIQKGLSQAQPNSGDQV